eukprot:CAMPEP_0177678028 /NCGR_PEP_ID=MMETSP0447-20121125/28769_1 /TAXON_ID=0 /ORGANISM="Stygamoeba regulata, Strain BSH-02190019" /LENGTH=547 /DNA_ID=CAMNT_0019186961 /DNA_START=102 /DNA_END=1746 /DNA_ORIENTATION=-
MADDENFDSSVERKALKMQKKSVEVQKRFNLQETETVIQDYFCSLSRTINHTGRMWITQNYVCFYSGQPFKIVEYFSFRRVVNITETPGVLSRSITIDLNDDRTLVFAAFRHFEETLLVLTHLWKNPPSYARISDARPGEWDLGYMDRRDEAEMRQAARCASRGGYGGGAGPSTGGAAGGGRPGAAAPPPIPAPYGSGSYGSSGGYGGGGSGSEDSGFFSSLTQERRTKVDLDTSKNALRIALDTREMGADTLEELERQRRQLDRIEHNVENIHHNLDRGERMIRGLESVGGGLKNTFTRDKTKKNYRQYDEKDHHRDWQNRKNRNVDIVILLKRDDDSFASVRLTLENESFHVKDEDGNKVKGLSWSYDMVDEVVLRARPQHVDVRFKDKTPRFRMMSAHVQAIVNELVIRARALGETPKVLFEPNAKQFHYGTYRLALSGSSMSKAGGEGAEGGATDAASAGFIRPKIKASELLSQNADAETRRALDMQDQHLDQIIDVVDDIHHMGVVMKEEIVDSTEQIDRINRRVDHANVRVHKSNFKMKKM